MFSAFLLGAGGRALTVMNRAKVVGDMARAFIQQFRWLRCGLSRGLD